MMEDLLILPPTPMIFPPMIVGVAPEAERTQLRFGEIVEGSRKAPHLAVVEFYAARVLLSAPNHFFLFFTAAFRENVRCNDHRGKEQESAKENYQEESVATFPALPCRFLASSAHADGGAACSSTMAVPRSREEISSYSRLALPILRMRKRFSKSSPSPTTYTSSPSLKKARRVVPLGTVP